VRVGLIAICASFGIGLIQGTLDELTNWVGWDTIFEKRRKTINFACEVPVIIEQGLFALARAIQQSLE